MVRRSFIRWEAIGTMLLSGWIFLWPLAGAAEIRPLSPKERQAYEALSPFEFKNILIEMAGKACRDGATPDGACRVLNAGRGNPNFLNTTAREGFSRLNSFAAALAGETGSSPHLGFRPEKRGIAGRLNRYLDRQGGGEAVAFLRKALVYAETELGIAPDDLVFELTDAILGDFYPSPPRMLPLTERIVLAYLKRIHFRNDKPPAGVFDLFATEGATAAMIYVFQSLRENKLLKPGDRIAIVTPIFSPYLEIPLLNDYELVPVYVKGDEARGWQVSEAELGKLEDPGIKALFMVNPMNPGSVSLSARAVSRIAEMIRSQRKDLIVLTDTVYAPFVDTFHDLLGVAPENTIGVYSYSKYFGVTGWRLGVIILQRNNVIDAMIARLPDKEKADLNRRYGIDSTAPESIPFIDRLVMDSREVALAHTGGLSTPQQGIMALFSLFELVDRDQAYKRSIQTILSKRMGNLYRPLGLPRPVGPDQTNYYALIDVGSLAGSLYGTDFARFLMETYSPLDLLTHLAGTYATVLLPGDGFAGPKWSLRVSLANLDDDAYAAIGKNIRATLAAFHELWTTRGKR